jgi:hypothetical protein
MNDAVVTDDLSEGEQAILRRLAKKPIDLYYGRNGWVPDGLPRPAKRADFDSICKREPELVKIKMAQLMLANDGQ